MNKKSVAVIFGGVSSEHEVSCVSASSVIKNIDVNKYDLHIIGITKTGKWYYFNGPLDMLPDGSWENSDYITPAVISPDRDTHGMLVFEKDGVKTIKIDVIFPVLHGRNGEDGTMQGLFELAGIPYVGCDVPSSAICMDKALTNTMLEMGKIDQAKYVWFFGREYFENPEKYLNLTEEKIGYPCFVKPANAGSSVGITKAENRDSLKKAIELAADNDFKIVIEENIVGAECEVAVLGNENPVASVVGEIAPANDWYDYEAKYHNAQSELYIPARLSEEMQNKVREKAVEAYKLLGCSGLTRVDFFVTEDGRILLNEPNTLPGFTSISMYPKLFAASGIEYGKLIDMLLSYAAERMEQK